MLKINKIYAHKYVRCLPHDLELKIMSEVRKAVSTLWLTESEKKEAIENANNEKICNLTDTIEIEFI